MNNIKEKNELLIKEKEKEEINNNLNSLDREIKENKNISSSNIK